MNKVFARAIVICVLLISSSSLYGFYQNLGIVRGTVINEDNQHVSDVVVAFAAGQATLTDGQGLFSVSGVKTGNQTVLFQFPGYESLEKTVDVKPGINDLGEVTMKLYATGEEILVLGSIGEGQARALNQQRLSNTIKNIVAADQIGAFPDTNAAEATQRVPGVNIARDQGEGRYVQVRGTEARLNQTALNGEPLPAPEGDLRTVALDVVPLEMLEAIEVTKAITPDMDGDAVGGAVNLRLRKAPRERMLAASVEYGYTELEEEPISGGSLLFGQQFQNGLYGLVGSLSFEETDRGTDNFEVEYDDGLPEQLEQRDYDVNRERIGAHLAFDYNPSVNANFELNGSYSQFDDHEFRRRLRHRVDRDTLERELKDRYETQSILTLQAKADIITGALGHFEVSANYSYARESEPGRFDSTFEQEDVIFNPNFGSGSFDGTNIQPNPTNQDVNAYVLDEIVREDNTTNDEHLTLKASYEWPVVFGDHTALFKAGLKHRQKEKMRDNNAVEIDIDGDIMLRDYLDSGYNRSGFLGGRYAMGPFHGRAQVADIINRFGAGEEVDFETDAADYRLEEDLTAAYFMSTIEMSNNLMILPGVRFESFSTDYVGYQVLFDDEGDYASTLPVPGDNDEAIFLPMLHLKYRFNENTQLRFAQTKTYARARVYDQVPYRLILQEDFEIEEGNPNLEITQSWNTDIMFEHYFADGGMLSAGLFTKDMEDYIYIFRNDELIDGEEFEVTRPLNGEAAELYGFELAFQKMFKNGLGFYLNYTYSDSEAAFQDREGTILPGQTESLGNLALIYERNGLSLRLSGNLHGEYLDEVGGDASEDLYVDEHFQVDFNGSYTADRYKIYVELVNLNDEEVVLYEGNRNNPIQFEQYKLWGRLGVKVDF
ncbi:TonB-dependent receptor [Acanthopleuribacter pedis]|uniref:TonB-dependent receptor n=1 Tax=Acanthopleuribacter pedis TaxID=442870 RepID=A0A8J7QRE3_9BACT|nr:TonB-dependent receptor [Acanthopleuribacter pedis]MBO1323315.1 TonB-dependent receptor [Acanthopleuribacter pedis]